LQLIATPLISGTGKATDFKFCRNIHRVDRNKSPMKSVGNSSRAWRSQGVPKIFRAPMYRAHCAVIFGIAQLSCYVYPFVIEPQFAIRVCYSCKRHRQC